MRIILTVLLAALIVSCASNSEFLKRKSTQNVVFKEYCTVKEFSGKPSIDKHYYWFKSQQVHVTEGDVGGVVLHGAYVKHYITNELAEKGVFKNGLKRSTWKSWYRNGTLKTIERWSNGLRTGKFLRYDSKGELLEKGRYRANKKVGKWINYKTKDTLRYRNGRIKIKDTMIKKPSIWKRLFKKSDANGKNKKGKKAKEQKQKVAKDTTNKKSWLKRIFAKRKNKKKKTN